MSSTNLDNDTPIPEKRRRPESVDGMTLKSKTPLGNVYCTITHDSNGEPLEVFIHSSKNGSDIKGLTEALGRTISYMLRIPSEIPPTVRLRAIGQDLKGIGGNGNQVGFGENRVISVPDAVGQMLLQYLEVRRQLAQSEKSDADDASKPNPGTVISFR